MRAAAADVRARACGRARLRPGRDQPITGGSALRHDGVTDWVVASGGTIDVTLAGDVDGATISVERRAVTPSPTAVHCVAPANAPGSVAVTATNRRATPRFGPRSRTSPRHYQVGGALDDNTSGVAVDHDGNNLQSAAARPARSDGANKGGFDAVLVSTDVTASSRGIGQLGNAGLDYARDVAVDPQGNATIVGYHRRDLHGPNAGIDDVFHRALRTRRHASVGHADRFAGRRSGWTSRRRRRQHRRRRCRPPAS